MKSFSNASFGRRGRVIRLLTASAAVTLMLTGCSAAAVEPTPTAVDFKVCLVSPTAKIVAGSPADQALDAIERAVLTRGVQFDEAYFTQTQSTGSYVAAMNRLVEGGCDFVLAATHRMSKAVHEAALANPKAKFALVDATLVNDTGESVDLANVIEINADVATQAFLAGYRAAGETKTGIVAAIGGDRLTPTTNILFAFKQGVSLFNSTNGTNVLLLGVSGVEPSGWAATSSWASAGKTARLASSYIDRGADVLMLATGTTEVSGLEAKLKESGTLLVSIDGVTTEVSGMGEGSTRLTDSTLAVIAKAIELPTFASIASALDGAFIAGESTVAVTGIDQEFAVSPSGDMTNSLREILEAINAGTLAIKQNS
jgi:basic membrane protein A